MVGRNVDKTLEKIVAAHGGAEYWNSLDAVEAEISAWGFLFTMKRVPALNRVRVRASTREPRFTFFDFPAREQRGELVGKEEVRITGSDGKTVARRFHPRSAFRGLRHWFAWDSLDFVYFGGYATWNYFATPFVFLRDGFEFEEMDPIQGTYGRWSRLRVTFPDDLPRHCRTQIFYFDENWLLRRLDYTAEVVGNWAHAAHFCEDYREFGGLKVPTRRLVKPLLGSKILPGPTLVAIEIHDMHPIAASSNPENF